MSKTLDEVETAGTAVSYYREDSCEQLWERKGLTGAGWDGPAAVSDPSSAARRLDPGGTVGWSAAAADGGRGSERFARPEPFGCVSGWPVADP
jgi:hypothetical protein